ncbi:MAG TPA: nucleotidyltransferase family protein [Salinisphaeraceae bacterium]|nr:nucleotidyltransferase family protein [Salinisphaeraceae bacterium]
MKAMLLAAGRGERLRPLTDDTPKPLLQVGQRALIEHHLLALARAGFKEVIINIAWHAGQIQAALGNGRRFGLRIHYSLETAGALDTGGGVRAALPLLGKAPFLLVSADTFTDFDFARLREPAVVAGSARVVLVDNPPHHHAGDFALQGGCVSNAPRQYTYAGIGVYAPDLFARESEPSFPLAQVIRRAAAAGRVQGLHHAGVWLDVGRPATLAAARAHFAAICKAT